ELDRMRRGVRVNIGRRFGISLEPGHVSGATQSWHEEVHRVVAASLTVLRDELFADADAGSRAELVRRLREWGPAFLTRHHRHHLLAALDEGWMQLSGELAEMRDSVSLLSYGFRRPFDQYRRGAFEAFERM